MGFLDQEKFRLDNNIYSPSVILDSAKNYSEFADVKIIEVGKDSCEISVSIKKEHAEGAEKIKGELLNFILGSSCTELLKESE